VPNGSEHFEVHASVVFQLGESLISDSAQALMELVKNSYDADASYCKVTISTAGAPPESYFKNAQGAIIVEDDGSGMTMADIRRGWLTISNSSKRDLKQLKKTTLGGRTPLGDKGLGRLGTQRLGVNLEMFTVPQEEHLEHVVRIPWGDFREKALLSEIPVFYESHESQQKHGTKLIITDLRDIEAWTGQTAIASLTDRLSQMISPYREVRNFTIIASIDGHSLDLIEVDEKLRETAQLHYDLDFNGDVLSIAGFAKLGYLRPADARERASYSELIESDGGSAYLSFLQNRYADKFNFSRAGKNGWFATFSDKNEFDDLPTPGKVDGEPANPGPFSGAVDFFDLGRESTAEQDIFDKATEYRNYIKKVSGIRVYRDGFGIRVDSDWLKLGEQWTKAGSYYGLKPQNTLGYITLTAANNFNLEETTDREGFKATPYYQNFEALLKKFVDYSGQVQEALRRGVIEFRNQRQLSAASISTDSSPEQLSVAIRERLSQAAGHRAALATMRVRLQNKAQASNEIVAKLSRGATGAAELEPVRTQLAELQSVVDASRRSIEEIEKYLGELQELENVNAVLREQITALREQIQQVYEVVGLGLTAEAVSHEINNIAAQLAERNQQLTRHLRADNIRDASIHSFTQYVTTTVAGLRRQLIFLAPSLKYLREKREDIDVREFLQELVRHYTPALSQQRIGFGFEAKQEQRFLVRMNRGKLIQVVDNFVRNSEYWLKQDIAANRIATGRITFGLTRPHLTISDNGRGVDPSLQGRIFEPFVTAKKSGEGRGLGLYIVQQLLHAESCDARLLTEENSFGRRYKFDIDLTGVAID
jgi:signal transduction histidine kinase